MNYWVKTIILFENHVGDGDTTPSRTFGILQNWNVQEKFHRSVIFRKRTIEKNPYLVQFCEQRSELAVENLGWEATPSMCILEVPISVFQTHHRRVSILQNQRTRIQIDETQVILTIIFGILRVTQTSQKIQRMLPQPNQLRDTSILLIGGVDRRGTEESGMYIEVVISFLFFLIIASTKRNRCSLLNESE